MGSCLAETDSPTDYPLVKSVVQGARRKLSRPVQPKQPLSRDVVADIAVRLNTTDAYLADIRFLFILLVGYTGIFRIGNILDIRIKRQIFLMITWLLL